MFGFGKKKEQTEKIQKPELLEKKNIRLDCSPMAKDDVIRAVGQLLCDSGYVDEGYIEAMIKGPSALPLISSSTASGIAVMVFPEGTDWGTEKVNLVIGIAGVGEDHLEILATIAEKMATPEAVEELIKGSADDIYAAFTTKA